MRDGDTAFDCLAIVDELYGNHSYPITPSAKASRWALLWSDLLNRSRGEQDRLALLKRALLSQLPEDLRPMNTKALPLDTGVGAQAKLFADVVVVCVIEEEFNAALVAFGLSRASARIRRVFGHSFVRLELLSREGAELIVWIGLIGAPRNVPCTNFCRDLFESFRVIHGCVLVGIAAGHPDKARLGDVIGAKMIWDIEGERVEQRASQPRLVPYTLKVPWNLVFVGFNPLRLDWLSKWKRLITGLRRSGSIVPAKDLLRLPDYRCGIILAGEKLRRDGALVDMNERFGDEIVALEMEGSGFAAACSRKDKTWFVFRGVADYGDGDKTDEWQATASLNAALAARTFIENELTTPPEPADDIPL